MRIQEKEKVGAKAPRYRWTVLIIWMTGHVWGYVFLGSLGFLLPSMREELGLSPIQEGLLGSAPPVANMFLAIPFGWFLSRLRPKLLTSISFFAAAGLVFFQGWAPVFIILLLGRFLYGVISIAREPARVLLIRQWILPNEIVIANALANFLWGIVGVGFVLTPVILRLLDNSWRNTLYVFGVVSLVLAVVWQIFGKERITPEYEAQLRSQDTSPIGSIFRHRELWLLGLGMMGIGINFSAFSTFWPSFRLDEYGMSLTASAIVMGVGGLFSSVTGIVVGILVARKGRKRQVLLMSGVVIALTSVALLWTGSYSLLLLIFVVQSVGWTFFPVTMTSPYEFSGIKPREVVVMVSLLYTMLWVGAFTGPILAGVVQEVSGDLRMALTVTSLAALTMTIGGAMLPRAWDLAPAQLRPESA